MARDRKRAKQRQQRRAKGADPSARGADASAQRSGADKPGLGPEPAQPLHENVPESLEHASGPIQEFDAELIAGAGGEVSDPDPEPTREELDRPAERGGPPGSRPPAVRERPSGNRVVAFLRASWAELQRVQWPDRRQVAQATGVVLGFVAIAGA
ncbi:MAG TPA: preprotein translocase subunit SecE, partial [Solirubrobacteraceae bacterium]|nr:preprotein translocase subunit SecE [Solirubrobacteraceae bacterium]